VSVFGGGFYDGQWGQTSTANYGTKRSEKYQKNRAMLASIVRTYAYSFVGHATSFDTLVSLGMNLFLYGLLIQNPNNAQYYRKARGTV
jgi:hypothetical protein